jgi:hypothetical protein
VSTVNLEYVLFIAFSVLRTYKFTGHDDYGSAACINLKLARYDYCSVTLIDVFSTSAVNCGQVSMPSYDFQTISTTF